jgi:hypothetical protein
MNQDHSDFIQGFNDDVANNVDGFELTISYKRGNGRSKTFKFDGINSQSNIINIMNAFTKERNNWGGDMANIISNSGGDPDPNTP